MTDEQYQDLPKSLTRLLTVTDLRVIALLRIRGPLPLETIETAVPYAMAAVHSMYRGGLVAEAPDHRWKLNRPAINAMVADLIEITGAALPGRDLFPVDPRRAIRCPVCAIGWDEHPIEGSTCYQYRPPTTATNTEA